MLYYLFRYIGPPFLTICMPFKCQRNKTDVNIFSPPKPIDIWWNEAHCPLDAKVDGIV